jgi:putative phosphoribosyl transferase
MRNMDQTPFLFWNRTEAGKRLARMLTRYAGRTDIVVLALPRGGLPVGFEIAQSLHAPLDVLLVRKLGVPDHDQLAMGAVATGNVRVLHANIIQAWRISPSAIARATAEQLEELGRRERLYRGARGSPDVRGRTVILVDDGVATGSSMYAAVDALRQLQPLRIVVAVPVAPPETYRELRKKVHEVVCLATPEPFQAVGRWFEDFRQLGDDEVRSILQRSEQRYVTRAINSSC